MPCRTSAQTCESQVCLVRARIWESFPVVQIVRGVADLIARPLPHNTQRAFLHHRLPLSSPQDIQRCCHPGQRGDTRCPPGLGNSAAQGCPFGLAWGGTHGDDAGEYSTAAGTTKALSGVVCISQLPGGWSRLSSCTPWRRPCAHVGGRVSRGRRSSDAPSVRSPKCMRSRAPRCCGRAPSGAVTVRWPLGALPQVGQMLSWRVHKNNRHLLCLSLVHYFVTL